SPARCFLRCCCAPLRHPRSFPTRRSSDLACSALRDVWAYWCLPLTHHAARSRGGGHRERCHRLCCPEVHRPGERKGSEATHRRRSEEHTSELQSRENLVCRLLLEKKKTSE